MPSHYLNQCCVIVNWTLNNILQWNFNQNKNIFFHKNTSETIVCEMAAILFGGGGGRWVNRYWGLDYLFPWQNRSYDQLSLCVKFEMQDYSPSFADSAYSMQWYFIDDRWTAHIYIFVSGTKCSCVRYKIIINGSCTLEWWWDLPSITKLMEFWLKINFQCIPNICFLAIHWILVKHNQSGRSPKVVALFLLQTLVAI